MNKPVTITTQIDEATYADVERISAEQHMSRDQLVGHVLKRFVEDQAGWDRAIQQGVDELDAGQTVDHATVMAEMDAMIARHRARCVR